MNPGDRVPIVLGHLVDKVVAGDPGIVDEDVERTEAQHDLLDHALDLVGFADISPEPHRLDAATRGDLRRGRLRRGKVEIAEHHRRAVFRETLGGRRPDPARPTGDQRHAALRTSRHSFPLSSVFRLLLPRPL
jgi:hypothetical protein